MNDDLIGLRNQLDATREAELEFKKRANNLAADLDEARAAIDKLRIELRQTRHLLDYTRELFIEVVRA